MKPFRQPAHDRGREQEAQEKAKGGPQQIGGAASGGKDGHAAEPQEKIDPHAQAAVLPAQDKSCQESKIKLECEVHGKRLYGDRDLDKRSDGHQGGKKAAHSQSLHFFVCFGDRSPALVIHQLYAPALINKIRMFHSCSLSKSRMLFLL